MDKLLYISIALLLLVSCRNSERDNDTLTNTSEENAIAQAIYSDVFQMMHQAALHTQGISADTINDTTLYGCDQIIADTTVSPRTLFIDFKFKGCVADYGISRKGRIIAEFTGTYPDSNSIVNILFLNYNFGNYTVDGNIIIVNRGTNAEGHPYLTFFLQNGIISTERYSTSWQANQTWELVKGGSTPSVADDEYSITGTSFGVNRNGNDFDAEAVTPNRLVKGCFHITSGTAKINIRNLSPRTIDYGSGECDREAVVTINGKDRQITLPQ